METPMQKLLNEINRTCVISKEFKQTIISYGYQIQEEAYDRGIKEGERRSKDSKK